MEQNEAGPDEGARAVHPSVATVAAAVATLPGRSDLRSFPQAEVVTYVQDLEVQAHKIYAASLAAVADIDERGLPASMGPMSLPRFLGPLLRCTEAEARRRVRASRAVQETLTVTGAIVPPALGATAAALAEGAVSGAHVDVIASVMNRLPRDLPVSDRDLAEDILADAARTLSPTTVAALGRRLIDTLDPDGEDPAKDEAKHAKKRGLWLRQLDDHSYELKARLTPDLGAKLRALIDFLSAPATRKKIEAAESAAEGTEFADTAQSLLGLADDTGDPRSPCQRHLDALAEIIDTFLNGGSISPLDVTSAGVSEADGGEEEGRSAAEDGADEGTGATAEDAGGATAAQGGDGPDPAGSGSGADFPDSAGDADLPDGADAAHRQGVDPDLVRRHGPGQAAATVTDLEAEGGPAVRSDPYRPISDESAVGSDVADPASEPPDAGEFRDDTSGAEQPGPVESDPVESGVAEPDALEAGAPDSGAPEAGVPDSGASEGRVLDSASGAGMPPEESGCVGTGSAVHANQSASTTASPGAPTSAAVRPARRGVVPQLILFGGVSDFAAKTGTAYTAQGDEIPMWAARQIVRDQASVFAVTLSTTGCVLDEGRSKRLATKSQIAAVIARDRGCTIRGCDRPISRCQVHHVREWVADAGSTNIDNLAAVCFWHHRWFAQLDYVCTMIDGVPHWTAPAWIDPERIPRRHERFDVHTAGAA